jgi:hypothetical protein
MISAIPSVVLEFGVNTSIANTLLSYIVQAYWLKVLHIVCLFTFAYCALD